MDTLINKKDLLKEEQQHNSQFKQKKTRYRPFLILIFFVLVLTLGVFFYFKIFSIEKVKVENFTKPQPLTVEQERQAVQDLQNTAKSLTNQQRDQKVKLFLN